MLDLKKAREAGEADWNDSEESSRMLKIQNLPRTILMTMTREKNRPSLGR